MNTGCRFISVVLGPACLTLCAAGDFTEGFTAAVSEKGEEYRDAVRAITNNVDAVTNLTSIVQRVPADKANVRQARILLARLTHPDVFEELERELKSTVPSGKRPGFLLGRLMTFVGRGPTKTRVLVPDHARRMNVSGRVLITRSKRKEVQMYTPEEVQTGIARNAAARQAVLECFLKFSEEKDAYEQAALMEAVEKLWGSMRNKSLGDYAERDFQLTTRAARKD